MQLSYWQILLTQWRGHGKDGLTIPFLIGAQDYFQIGKKHQTVDELLTAIARNGETDVYLAYCPTIKAIILGLRTEAKRNIAGKHLLLDDGQESKLFQTGFVRDLGDNLHSVCAALTERYQIYVDEGHYSINQSKWGSYNSDEVEFLKRCSSIQK